MSTHMVMVLDRSGSMAMIREDTVGGVKAYIADQADDNPDDLFTMVQFDTEFTFPIVAKRIGDVEFGEGDFTPRGRTALYDAVFHALAKAEEHRADRMVVVIVTDGQENASQEVSSAQLRARITELQEKEGWTFLFLSASMEAILDSRSNMGIKVAHSAPFGPGGQNVNKAYRAASNATLRAKKGGSVAYTEEEIRAMNQPDGKESSGE